jgi:hypothetical protein
MARSKSNKASRSRRHKSRNTSKRNPAESSDDGGEVLNQLDNYFSLGGDYLESISNVKVKPDFDPANHQSLHVKLFYTDNCVICNKLRNEVIPKITQKQNELYKQLADGESDTLGDKAPVTVYGQIYVPAVNKKEIIEKYKPYVGQNINKEKVNDYNLKPDQLDLPFIAFELINKNGEVIKVDGKEMKSVYDMSQYYNGGTFMSSLFLPTLSLIPALPSPFSLLSNFIDDSVILSSMIFEYEKFFLYEMYPEVFEFPLYVSYYGGVPRI